MKPDNISQLSLDIPLSTTEECSCTVHSTHIYTQIAPVLAKVMIFLVMWY